MPALVKSESPKAYTKLGIFKPYVIVAARSRGMGLSDYLRFAAIEQAKRDGASMPNEVVT